jgi:hypothetical protein
MSNTNNAAATVAIKVNQDRLLANLEFSFTNKQTMLGEVMQNARRAGASHVTFNYVKEGELLISDNGKGIDDFQNLFSIAESGWDAETLQKEKPFGMGWLSCLYGSDVIYVESAGRYIEGKSSDILAGAAIEVKTNGNDTQRSYTQIVLKGVKFSLDELKASLKVLSSGFAIPVYLNGDKFKQADALSDGFIAVEGVGDICAPEIDLKNIQYYHGGFDAYLAVYLQGLPVYDNRKSWREEVTVVVHLDSEIYNARMPDRDKLVNEKQVLDKISHAINDIHLDRLKSLKDNLSPEDFAKEEIASYALRIKGGFDLLCDKSVRLSSAFYGKVSTDQPSCWSDHADSVSSDVSSYSLEDIAAGKCVLFTTESMSQDEGCPAAWILARKLGFELIDNQTYWLKSDDFMGKHWAAPYVHELHEGNVKVEIISEGKSGRVGLNWWTCDMVLCDAYKITYTDQKTGKVYEALVDDEPLLTVDGKFLVPAKTSWIGDALYQAASYNHNDDLDENGFDEDERDINLYLEMLRSGSVIKSLEQILRQVNLNAYEDLKGQKFELFIDENLGISLSAITA